MRGLERIGGELVVFFPSSSALAIGDRMCWVLKQTLGDSLTGATLGSRAGPGRVTAFFVVSSVGHGVNSSVSLGEPHNEDRMEAGSVEPMTN